MRVVLTVLLIIAAAPVWAEWIMLYEDTMSVGYIDASTLRINGNVRTIMELQDIKFPTKQKVSSVVSLVEYDCKKKRFRLISGRAYSERTGNGKQLGVSKSTGDWHSSDYGKPARITIEAVCRLSPR